MKARVILRSSSRTGGRALSAVVQAIGGTTCACVRPNIDPHLRAVVTELLSPWVYDGRHRAYVAYYFRSPSAGVTERARRTAGPDVNDLTGPSGPKAGLGLEYLNIGSVSLAGGAGYAFLTLTNNHCCAQMPWNHGVWGSADGMTWTPVVEGDALVSSVASNGGTTVLAGHLGRGNDAAFWIGE